MYVNVFETQQETIQRHTRGLHEVERELRALPDRGVGGENYHAALSLYTRRSTHENGLMNAGLTPADVEAIRVSV